MTNPQNIGMAIRSATAAGIGVAHCPSSNMILSSGIAPVVDLRAAGVHVGLGVDGILYADRGNPALGPLVIKASSGSVFRAPLLRCTGIAEATRHCLDAGFRLYRLQAGAERSLFTGNFADRALFVLGGETDGLSAALCAFEGEDLGIPMAAGVESLNVAVSAALLAYTAAYLDR